MPALFEPHKPNLLTNQLLTTNTVKSAVIVDSCSVVILSAAMGSVSILDLPATGSRATSYDTRIQHFPACVTKTKYAIAKPAGAARMEYCL